MVPISQAPRTVQKNHKLSLAVMAARQRIGVKGMTRKDQLVFNNAKRALDEGVLKLRATFQVVS